MNNAGSIKKIGEGKHIYYVNVQRFSRNMQCWPFKPTGQSSVTLWERSGRGRSGGSSFLSVLHGPTSGATWRGKPEGEKTERESIKEDVELFG